MLKKEIKRQRHNLIMKRVQNEQEKIDQELKQHPAITKSISRLLDEVRDLKTNKIENIAIAVVLSLTFTVSFTTLVLLLLK